MPQVNSKRGQTASDDKGSIFDDESLLAVKFHRTFSYTKDGVEKTATVVKDSILKDCNIPGASGEDVPNSWEEIEKAVNAGTVTCWVYGKMQLYKANKSGRSSALPSGFQRT